MFKRQSAGNLGDEGVRMKVLSLWPDGVIQFGCRNTCDATTFYTSTYSLLKKGGGVLSELSSFGGDLRAVAFNEKIDGMTTFC